MEEASSEAASGHSLACFAETSVSVMVGKVENAPLFLAWQQIVENLQQRTTCHEMSRRSSLSARPLGFRPLGPAQQHLRAAPGCDAVILWTQAPAPLVGQCTMLGCKAQVSLSFEHCILSFNSDRPCPRLPLIPPLACTTQS